MAFLHCVNAFYFSKYKLLLIMSILCISFSCLATGVTYNQSKSECEKALNNPKIRKKAWDNHLSLFHRMEDQMENNLTDQPLIFSAGEMFTHTHRLCHKDARHSNIKDQDIQYSHLCWHSKIAFTYPVLRIQTAHIPLEKLKELMPDKMYEDLCYELIINGISHSLPDCLQKKMMAADGVLRLSDSLATKHGKKTMHAVVYLNEGKPSEKTETDHALIMSCVYKDYDEESEENPASCLPHKSPLYTFFHCLRYYVNGFSF